MKNIFERKTPTFFDSKVLLKSFDSNIEDLVKYELKAVENEEKLRFRQKFCKNLPDHKIYDPYYIKSVRNSLKKSILNVNLENLISSIIIKYKSTNRFLNNEIKLDSSLIESFFGKESLKIGLDNIVKNQIQTLFQFDDVKYQDSKDDFYKKSRRFSKKIKNQRFFPSAKRRIELLRIFLNSNSLDKDPNFNTNQNSSVLKIKGKIIVHPGLYYLFFNNFAYFQEERLTLYQIFIRMCELNQSLKTISFSSFCRLFVKRLGISYRKVK